MFFSTKRWFLSLLLLGMVACDGRTPNDTGSANAGDQSQPVLQEVAFGRLVDIYAYQRIDNTQADRRNLLNRRRVLVQRDVVVRSIIETQPLFDSAGEELPNANYEFMPFDVATGHEELLILWDNRGDEAARFQSALTSAQSGLTFLPPSYRGQNTQAQPIPVVPRDASLVLVFSGRVTQPAEFFELNPSALQLLEFAGDPATIGPVNAFRTVPYRVVVRDNFVILDPTILGGETRGGFVARGMPESLDQTTANMRIAIPSRGTVSPSFYVRQDSNQQLNDIDSFGRSAVIRDFRSGNQADGPAGVLRDLEPPMMVGSVTMGILTSNAATGEITLTKRGNAVPVRSRIPFVVGALNQRPQPNVPTLVLGPLNSLPTSRPLRAGDSLAQTVTVNRPDGTTEIVRLRAEILMNTDIGIAVGEDVGLLPGRASDAGLAQSNIVVGAVRGTDSLGFPLPTDAQGRPLDSLGRPVTWSQANSGDGVECQLLRYYYDNIAFRQGSEVISESDRRAQFLRVDPPPSPTGNFLPQATVALQFSEPIDFDLVDPARNFILSSSGLSGDPPGGPYALSARLANAKLLCANVVPSRLTDQSGDGTTLQLVPPLGFHYRNDASPDAYWFHMLLGAGGITDLSGNSVDIADDRTGLPQEGWSVAFTVDGGPTDNLVGWRAYPFEGADEDGTLQGSVDMFGQFRLVDGKLSAAQTVRFRKTADAFNLAGILRANRGNCVASTAGVPPNVISQGLVYDGPPGGTLYWTPRMVDTVEPPNIPQSFPGNPPGQPVGRVTEPHSVAGSRMQMRYLEDDFSLSNRLASDMAIDVEQLYWSPYEFQGDVQFDIFDRYTMGLSHANKRPDLQWVFVEVDGFPPPPQGPPPPPDRCRVDCLSLNSGLSDVRFQDNVLEGTSAQTVFQDKIYRIDPLDQFRSTDNVRYLSYPRFDRTYTWRDSRLVTTVGSNGIEDGVVTGLGGAQNPGRGNYVLGPANETDNDWTSDVDSPWIEANPIWAATAITPTNRGYFVSNRKKDHDPVALPLLVDFKVFPDSPANTLAQGINAFQVAMIGKPPSFRNPPAGANDPGGYYNTNPGIAPIFAAPPYGGNFVCTPNSTAPLLRVHSTGGFDPINRQTVTVDPANVTIPEGGWIKDAGAIIMALTTNEAPLTGNTTVDGIVRSPKGDAMLNWAAADFVRRVSTVTFGFIDTWRPNIQATGAASVSAGYPNLSALFPSQGTTPPSSQVGITTMVSIFDPPLSRQPAGTTTALEFRGMRLAERMDFPYDKAAQDTFNQRSNLLNPNFACEAYRYDQKSSDTDYLTERVNSDGLTAYVTQDRLDSIRNPFGVLPRYLNLRLVMTNNIGVTPATSPSLRSMSIVYKIENRQ